ncbi:MAG: branched-chain amino acid transaminase [Thermodesulfobacteriota bacterium]|nr:MAG: branched-chain amino acid transaminase [Thermodesulfobacteriota bacterium]
MEKAGKIWMDGRFVEWADANVHLMTHTLHYGLGVFEGIRCYECVDGRSAIFRLREHTKRLFASAHISLIEIPFTMDEISEATAETVRVNNLKQGYIRPLVYLGAGSMGLYPKDNPVRVAIAAWPWGAYLGEDGLANGIRVKISSFSRNHVNSGMTKAKIVGNYVNSILAKREVVASGFDEALLLDTEGFVSEGSGENIFIVRDGAIKTTSLTSILNGITRDAIITIARDKGLAVTEQRFTRDELYTADEAFFTGTAAEITPIREVDGRKIGPGKPGPITKAVQETFFSAVKGGDKSYEDWLWYI